MSCSIPFVLARIRGVNRRVDGMMDSVASWMGADPPSVSGKGSKQPAPKQFLRLMKVTKYVKPDDVEAAAEGGLRATVQSVTAWYDHLVCCTVPALLLRT